MLPLINVGVPAFCIYSQKWLDMEHRIDKSEN